MRRLRKKNWRAFRWAKCVWSGEVERVRQREREGRGKKEREGEGRTHPYCGVFYKDSNP